VQKKEKNRGGNRERGKSRESSQPSSLRPKKGGVSPKKCGSILWSKRNSLTCGEKTPVGRDRKHEREQNLLHLVRTSYPPCIIWKKQNERTIEELEKNALGRKNTERKGKSKPKNSLKKGTGYTLSSEKKRMPLQRTNFVRGIPRRKRSREKVSKRLTRGTPQLERTKASTSRAQTKKRVVLTKDRKPLHLRTKNAPAGEKRAGGEKNRSSQCQAKKEAAHEEWRKRI